MTSTAVVMVYNSSWLFPPSDLNECGLKPRPCEHRCMNTFGSYMCYCLNGFMLMPDGSCASKCKNDPYTAYTHALLHIFIFLQCKVLAPLPHTSVERKQHWAETRPQSAASKCFSSSNQTENILLDLIKSLECWCYVSVDFWDFLLFYDVKSALFDVLCCGQTRGRALWLTVSTAVRKFRAKFAASVPLLVYSSVQMEKPALVSEKQRR